MFGWINDLWKSINAGPRERLLSVLADLNASSQGGKPRMQFRRLGALAIPSGSIVIVDPMCGPTDGLTVTGLASREATISGELVVYPSGSTTVGRLSISFGVMPGNTTLVSHHIGVDSAKIVIADKDDLLSHWTSTGKERLGAITTARDDTVLKLLTQRFGLRTRQRNAVVADIVDPVTAELEKEILSYLKTFPEYAQFPFIYFSVITKNSFDRVNDLDGWKLLPIGNSDRPVMFACQTAHGDGRYEVACHQIDGVTHSLSVDLNC